MADETPRQKFKRLGLLLGRCEHEGIGVQIETLVPTDGSPGYLWVLTLHTERPSYEDWVGFRFHQDVGPLVDEATAFLDAEAGKTEAEQLEMARAHEGLAR